MDNMNWIFALLIFCITYMGVCTVYIVKMLARPYAYNVDLHVMVGVAYVLSIMFAALYLIQPLI